MSIINLTSKQLRRAASIKDQIVRLQNKLAKLVGRGSSGPAKTAKPRRTMSAAARTRIAAGARARWAKVKGKKSAKPAKKASRKISAAGRARIAAAAKARWKKAKVAGKNRL